MKIIYTPCRDMKEAKKIGNALIKKRLAACINIIPEMVSMYKWKGKIENAKESAMLCKTSDAKAKSAMNLISKMHSYNVPAILCFRVDDVNKEYLKWIKECC
jgi:periplasmic divalent cation tolerance protein